MAKVIESNVESRPFNVSYSSFRIILIGAAIGVLYWLFTLIISRFTDSMKIASDVATIIVAVIGLIIMVSVRTVRPLVIAGAAAISLWGLAQWTKGLVWSEIIAWNIFMYALAYSSFSWISRYSRLVPALIVAMTVIVLVRIATTL